MRTKIRIASVATAAISNGAIRTVIQDENGTQYSFFQLKRDGKKTKAQEGFEKIRPIQGDDVIVEVDEKASINAKTGKPVIYRNIMFFITDLEELQNAQSPIIQLDDEETTEESKAEEIPLDYGRRFDDLEAKVDKIISLLTPQAKKALPLKPSFPETAKQMEEEDGIKIEDVPF